MVPPEHHGNSAGSKGSRGRLIAALAGIVLLMLLGAYVIGDILWEPRYPDADPF
jgi:hypothetical protein